MLNGQKIIYIVITDNQSKLISDLGARIWNHEKRVKDLLVKSNCLMTRKTHDMTGWKGPKTWIITRNHEWKRSGLGLIYDLEDLHLHIEGDLYVLGGASLFSQLRDAVDEIHMYVLNSSSGKEEWMNIDMSEWRPFNYRNEDVWSYAHLKRKAKADPIDYMTDELFY